MVTLFFRSLFKLLLSVTAAVAVTLALQSPSVRAADPDTESLKQRLEMLEKEMQELRALLEQQEKSVATKQEVEAVKQDVQEVADVQSEWKQAKSVVHLAGYGDATFVAPDPGDSRFEVTFNPIFHYLYDDLLMMESELELSIDSEGETDIGLEYAALDLFMNDYATLVAGKFLSPIGNFRQNLHPSWINKMPAAPLGFGHGGAAPLADVGVQVRGGFPMGSRSHFNYAVFVANGPELKVDEHNESGGDEHGDAAAATAPLLAQVEDEHDEAGEDEHGDEMAAPELETEGFVDDPGENKVLGGRIGFIPIPGVELGVSAAFGQVPVTGSEQIPGEPERDYRTLGVDGVYQHGSGIELRGEWIQQRIDEDLASGLFPGKMTWEAWYLQGAYKFMRNKLEAVLRVGEFDGPTTSQEQIAFGLNYLFASNIIAKIAYESNDGQADRGFLQLAYGY